MNTSNPLVSCIIPTKNRPRLVEQAVQSVLSQSYRNIEIIVIDDSTNNETRERMRSRRGIRYLKNEKSRGASYSRNIGLREARGDVIAFLDDDDLWRPKKIEMQLALLETYPIVSCNYIRRLGSGRRQFVNLPPTVGFREMLCYNYLGSCSFLLFGREILRGCSFDEEIKVGQDWDLVLAAMRRHGLDKVGVVDRYLVDYNSGTHSRISTRGRAISAILPIFDKYRSEHTDFTTFMFFLYNMLPTNGSWVLWLSRELMKARMRNKGYLFVLRTILKRFKGRLDVY